MATFGRQRSHKFRPLEAAKLEVAKLLRSKKLDAEDAGRGEFFHGPDRPTTCSIHSVQI